jgi:hypothetical protein
MTATTVAAATTRTSRTTIRQHATEFKHRILQELDLLLRQLNVAPHPVEHTRRQDYTTENEEYGLH